MRYFVKIGSEELELDLKDAGDGGFQVTLAHPEGSSAPRSARVLGVSEDLCSVEVDGQLVELRLGRDGEANRVFGTATSVESARERAARGTERAAGESAGELRAPMPGRIVRVLCAAGAEVKKGDALLVMEAMKMENELCARADAMIAELAVAAGDTVERNALLVRFA